MAAAPDPIDDTTAARPPSPRPVMLWIGIIIAILIVGWLVMMFGFSGGAAPGAAAPDVPPAQSAPTG